jgi:tetratricopeptide (TPR) repeat protein
MTKGKPPFPVTPPQSAQPGDLATLARRAGECFQRGQWAQAEALSREALRFQPRHSASLQLLGLVALRRGDARGALAFLGKAVKYDPKNAVAHMNLGYAQQQAGQNAEALSSYNRSASLRPDHAEAHCNRGNVLLALGRAGEALTAYDRALGLRPDIPEALDGRGNALADLGRFDESLAAYARALEVRPDYVEALGNRAFVLTDLNRYAEALRDYDAALALRPGFGRLHFDAAMALLVTGDFGRGWREFEWRWRVEGGEQRPRGFAQPQWLGDAELAGRTILLHAEQGLGDSLHFCRYVPLVAARGARVLLEVQQPLTRLLAGLPGVAQVIAHGERLPEFDQHCPLLSLPLAFGTDLASIPAPRAYLSADAAAVARWSEALGERRVPRVGLAWSGSVRHRNDRNRSVPLGTLARLLAPGVEFVSLQKELRTEDRKALRAIPALRHFEDEMHDFADTAALVDCLDLVITVDTSVAHLAGALGKPVWILLPYAPDWRWLLEREDSPWYPSARLFRQPALGDWASVLDRVATELATFIDQATR